MSEEKLISEIERLKLKLERKDTLLKATMDILTQCNDSPYVLNPLEVTAFWDDAECDGCCLLAEIQDLYDEN